MLKAWSRDHFGSVLMRIKRTKDLMLRAKEASARTGFSNEVDRLKSKLNSLYDKEEKMRQQRSRLHWLKIVDHNTKFFHGTATQRKQKSFIKRWEWCVAGG